MNTKMTIKGTWFTSICHPFSCQMNNNLYQHAQCSIRCGQSQHINMLKPSHHHSDVDGCDRPLTERP